MMAKPTLGKQKETKRNKKKLRSTKGRTREQVSQLQTGPSHRKTHNPGHAYMEHCVHRVGK